MSTTYVNSLSNTGTNTLVKAAGGPGVTWNLTFCEVSFAGPSRGPNARITIYDGDVTGEILYRAFLDQPTGSIGMVQEINIPRDAHDRRALQALPGNAMTIVVDGFGANQCSINARFTDGLP